MQGGTKLQFFNLASNRYIELNIRFRLKGTTQDIDDEYPLIYPPSCHQHSAAKIQGRCQEGGSSS